MQNTLPPENTSGIGGYAATELHGQEAQLHGQEAKLSGICGYAATWLRGYGATRLEAKLGAGYFFFYIMLLFPRGKNHATQELNSFFNQCAEFETSILEPKQERYLNLTRSFINVPKQ